MKFSYSSKPWAGLSTALALALAATGAGAQVSSVPLSALPAGPANVTFTGVADFTELNNATVGGVLFTYSLGNGQIVVDGGPGATNNISEPNLVSIGNNAGVLTLTLPGSYTLFGFGYALLAADNITNAVSVTAFNGVTNLGSLSYNGVVDPLFTGGFAGLQSVTAFNRLQLTFNSTQASAFAVDNIRFANASVNVVPEPSSLLLVSLGFGVVAMIGRRRVASRTGNTGLTVG